MSFFIDHVTQLTSTKTITPLTDYNVTTDYLWDVRGMNRKDVLIMASGATGMTGISYTVQASMDDANLHNGPTGAATWDERAAARMVNNVSYDITHSNETSLVAGAQVRIAFTDLYTFMKIRTKSAGSASVTIKANAASN